MSHRFAYRLIMLGLLSGSSFWATTTLLGQAAGDRTAGSLKQQRSLNKSAISVTRRGPGDDDQRLLQRVREAERRDFETPPEHLLAARSLRGFDVHVVGNTITVNQSVEIMDKRPGFRYFWRLVVRDHSNRDLILVDRPYYQQIFGVPNGRMKPTFSDMAVLPPGKYRAEVRLYEVPPQVPLSRFQEPRYAASQLTVTGTKVVTIPPAP